MYKKLLSWLLTLAMIFTMIGGLSVPAFGMGFSDMPEDWSTIALENAVSNGLLNGADGKIMPKENLTRAQMATIINRAFGAEVKEDISNFNDVPNEAWFFDEMAKAVHMKTFMGSNNKLNPNDPITREQAFLVISRALKLKNSGEELEGFNDLDQISEWAKDGVYSLIQNEYLQGSNGNINPKGNITRAEFAQLMDNIIKHYLKEEGEYTELPQGNIMISVPGVTLKDVTVTGDLIIGDGVGEGDVTLDNVEVTGKMIVRGGGENSILIKGNSKIKEITVAKVDGKIRVYAEDGTEIETVYVDDGKDKVMLQGRFNSVVIQTDTEISIDDAKIDKITLQSPKSNISVGETSTITDIEIEKEAEESTVKVEGTVTTLTTSAPSTKVEGEGTLETINAEEGSDDSVFTVPDAKVTAEADVLVNETEVKAGEEATINDEGTDVVVEEQTTSSGGSSGSSSTVDVTGITLDKTSITIKLREGTETITPIISPSNASNKSVNWESSDETVATVSGGVVCPVSEGNTTITAVTVDGGYEAICEVKVTPEDPDIINFSGTYDGLAHSIEVTNEISGDTVHYSTDGGTTWSTTNPEFIDVGNYLLDVKVKNTSFEDRTSSGTVTITKRDISITASSDSKVYDGSGLTNDNYSITDGTLAANQTLDSVTVTGSQIEVGSSLNVPSGAVITDSSANDVTENYNITYINGTLEVTKATGDALSVDGFNGTYDGLSHSITVNNTILGDAVYYSTDGGTNWETTNPEFINAGTYTVDVKVQNPNYEDRTSSGTVTISKRDLSITASSDSKVYDGTELTKNGYTYIGTIAPNQVIDSVTVTGSQKYVGSSDNIPSGAVITDASSNDVTSNYSISYINGTLTVTQANINITVTANSDTKEYDGTPLTNSGFTVTEGSLLPGDYIEADITGSITEVGTTNNIISNITVKNNGVDVTENYNITSLNGNLQVTERLITITATSDSKVYDGTELTNGDYSITGTLASGESLDSVTVTGSQTEVGSSDNIPSGAVITDASSNDVTSNYDITYSNGTLEVRKATGDALSIDGFTGTYDGLAHSIEVTNEISGDTLYYSTDGGSNWETTNPEFINVGTYTVDVKVQNPNYEDRTSSGTVTISKRDLSITASSDSKVYDGTELTNPGYSRTSGTLADNQTLDSVTVTGSQKYVGSSNNTPSEAVIIDDSSNDVTSNYNITYIDGSLTITEADISIEFTSASDSKVYDGTPLSNDGYTYIGDLIDGDVIQQVEIFRSITDVGTIDNTIGLIYIMNDGVDVTENYFYGFRYFYGELEVTKRPITITASSDSKVYDGSELTNSGYTITSGTLAPGQSLDSVTVTGSQTEIGSSANVASGAIITDASLNDVTSNYDITYVDGTLTVEENEPTGILIDADSGSDFIGVLYSREGILFYNEVSSSGTWQGEIEIGTSIEGKIAIDSSDNPHIAFTTSAGSIGYTMYDGSDWSTEEFILSLNIGAIGACSKPDIAVDGGGNPHITYTDSHGTSDDYSMPDIMYANKTNDNFNVAVVYRGYRDYSSSGSWGANYYNKGSYIDVNDTGDYFILSHKHNIWRWFNGTDNTYYIVVKSNLGEGNIQNYGSDIFDIYDIKSNIGKVVALYKESTFKTSDLEVNAGTINFTNINGVGGTDVSSVASNGTDTVVGGLSAVNLYTSYNGIDKIYGSILTNGNVSVVNTGVGFYAIYTDTNDGKIKLVEVEAPLQTLTPTITTLSQTVNETTINIQGTSEPDSQITITGGSETTNGEADSSGNFDIAVSLTEDSVNSLNVTAQSPGKTLSNVASVDITHVTPEPAPEGTLLHAKGYGDIMIALYTRDGNIYLKRQINLSQWEAETLVGPGIEGNLDINNTNGDVHVVYTTNDKIGYRMYNGSTLTDEILIESNNGGICSKPDIAVENSGFAHITYTDTLGNTGDNVDHADIMYATNTSGVFVKELVSNGFYTEDGVEDYYDKGAFITVDNDRHYILSHHFYNGTHYKVNIKIPTEWTLGSNYGSDIFNIFDIINKDGSIYALYRHDNIRLGLISVIDNSLDISIKEEVEGITSAYSVDIIGEDSVIGSKSGDNLQVHYNGTTMTYSDISVSGDAVSIITLNGKFYAVYTDTSDGKIKMTEVEAPLQTSTPTITTTPQTVNVTSINIEGTAEPDSQITITGGSETANGTADSSGNFNIAVTLTEDSVNSLNVTAQATGKTVSNVANVVITHVTPEPAPAASSIVPNDGGTEVPTDVTVSIVFDRDITLLNGLSGVTIYNNSETSYVPEVSPSFEEANNKIVISHGEFLENNSFTVTIPANTVQNSEGTGNEEITWSFTTVTPGAEITINDVLQMGVSETATASTTESGAGGWTSDMESVATINFNTGEITALSDGNTIISYTTSDSGKTSSIEVDVYQQPSDVSSSLVFSGDSPTSISSGTKQLTGFPDTVNIDETRTFEIIDGTSDVITVDNDGLVTYVADGTKTVRYELKETATGMIVEYGEVTITATPPTPPSLNWTDPDDNTTNVAIALDLRLQFDENVTEVGSNLDNISITYNSGADSASNVVSTIDSGDPRTILISHNEFLEGTLYTVNVPSNTVQNTQSVGNEEVTWSFTTYASPPSITNVETTAGGIKKIGQELYFTIYADSNGYLAEDIIINGATLVSNGNDSTGTFTDVGNGSYTIAYTVSEGDNDKLDSTTVPVSIVLNNKGALNDSYDGNAVSQYSFSIDANRPIPLSALVEDSNPNEIVVVFSETIIGHEDNGFIIKVDDVEATVNSVVGSGTNTLTFTLSNSITQSNQATVEYEGYNGSLGGDFADTSANKLEYFIMDVINNVID